MFLPGLLRVYLDPRRGFLSPADGIHALVVKRKQGVIMRTSFNQGVRLKRAQTIATRYPDYPGMHQLGRFNLPFSPAVPGLHHYRITVPQIFRFGGGGIDANNSFIRVLGIDFGQPGVSGRIPLASWVK